MAFRACLLILALVAHAPLTRAEDSSAPRLAADEAIRKVRETFFPIGLQLPLPATHDGSGPAVTFRDGNLELISELARRKKFEWDLERCLALDSGNEHQVCGRAFAAFSAGLLEMDAAGGASLRYETRVDNSTFFYFKPASADASTDWRYLSGGGPQTIWKAESAVGIAVDSP